jgi:hypothetical protein
VHGVEQQREPEVVVTDEGGEGELRTAHPGETARPVVTTGRSVGAP